MYDLERIGIPLYHEFMLIELIYMMSQRRAMTGNTNGHKWTGRSFLHFDILEFIPVVLIFIIALFLHRRFLLYAARPA